MKPKKKHNHEFRQLIPMHNGWINNYGGTGVYYLF
jgi:glutamate synthase domain-containing protein 1